MATRLVTHAQHRVEHARHALITQLEDTQLEDYCYLCCLCVSMAHTQHAHTQQHAYCSEHARGSHPLACPTPLEDTEAFSTRRLRHAVTVLLACLTWPEFASTDIHHLCPVANQSKRSTSGLLSPNNARHLRSVAQQSKRIRLAARLDPWGKSLPCSCHKVLCVRVSFGTWDRACRNPAHTCVG